MAGVAGMPLLLLALTHLAGPPPGPAAPASPSPPAARVHVEELARLPEQVDMIGARLVLTVAQDDDGRWHYAFVDRSDGCRAVIDGQRKPEVETIRSFQVCNQVFLFSPDARRVAYLADLSAPFAGKCVMIIDGRPQMMIDDGVTSAAQFGCEIVHRGFSGDGRRFGYGAKVGRKERMIVDGQAQAEMDWVGQIHFTNDSRHCYYAARTDDRTAMVVDGTVSPLAYDRISLLNVQNFSPGQVVYVGRRGQQAFAVIDSEEGLPFDSVSQIVLSADGRLAYVANRGGDLFIVRGRLAQALPRTTVRVHISDDALRVAVVEEREGAFRVVVDGRAGPEHWRIVWGGFSPDGRHFAYCAAQRRERQSIILNGQAGPVWESIRAPRFHPRTSRLYYVARKDSKEYLVWDGQPGPALKKVDYVETSADGSHVACTGSTTDGKPILLIDRTPLHSYGAMHRPSFSADGRHVLCLAHKNGRQFCVVDAQAGPAFDKILQAERGHWIDPLRFAPDNTVEYLALRGRTLYRVRHAPTE